MTRPRLQLHLSTLLIVTALAAGLVWLNVQARDWKEWQGQDAPPIEAEVMDIGPGYIYWTGRGWPYPFHQWYTFIEGSEEWGDGKWNWSRVYADGAICIALLVVAAVAIEWFTRRIKQKATP